MSNTIYDGKPSSKNYHKYNYVYLITNITNNKKYIGSRSCDIDPYIDIKRYKSSSNNKEFKLDQKNNPQNKDLISYVCNHYKGFHL